ncbi:hypothetical protein PG999_009388 [Apiospora kogelbergensis]|uniref:Uncharacterized protein n=1 Tax=Apiospora kogelbergensis TaxID=1337665 RepID=A0AAW0QKN0_9PEZI
MKFESTAAMAVMLGVATARPDAVLQALNRQLSRREVPQEHSHDNILNVVATSLKLDNPDNIQDPVFSLLGNKAAAEGAGNVKDLDCLQQRIADQAFTNAKAANDVDGMANALIFRALERNTGSVGLASVLCKSETAKNPEVAALQQHQDPASDGAAELNKQIALTLATQLSSIGADPALAIQSGTFAPGKVGDTTGAGNTCDDIDPKGCINTKGLLVPDVTEAEIQSAVANGGAAVGNSTNNAGNNNKASASASAVASATASATRAAGAKQSGNANAGNKNNNNAGNNNNNNAGNGNAATATNLNKFSGSTGAAPIPITSDSASSKPFGVNGSQFVNLGAAAQRACDVQKNACANAVNGGKDNSIKVADCDAQQQQCVSANGGKKRRQANGGKLDTGSCGSPAIQFSSNLADRKGESAFVPVNTKDFAHGSAQKPAIITQFICQQLGSKCKASAATVSTCNQAAQAANAASGQAAANAFNSALGV